MTAKEVVREVICLFKGGERWAKGGYMKTADDRNVETYDGPQSEKAAKFCLLGAAHRVLGLKEFKRAREHDVLREFSALIRDSLPKAKREAFQANGNVSKGYVAASNSYEEDPGDYVVAFNDEGCTTFDQIERVLAKALVRKSKRSKKQATA